MKNARSKKDFLSRISEMEKPVLIIMKKDRCDTYFKIEDEANKGRKFFLPGTKRIAFHDTQMSYIEREKKFTEKYIKWLDAACDNYRVEEVEI